MLQGKRRTLGHALICLLASLEGIVDTTTVLYLESSCRLTGTKALRLVDLLDGFLHSLTFQVTPLTYSPKIANREKRSHDATGNKVGRPLSVKSSLEQIQADIDDYIRERLSKCNEEVARYIRFRFS